MTSIAMDRKSQWETSSKPTKKGGTKSEHINLFLERGTNGMTIKHNEPLLKEISRFSRKGSVGVRYRNRKHSLKESDQIVHRVILRCLDEFEGEIGTPYALYQTFVQMWYHTLVHMKNEERNELKLIENNTIDQFRQFLEEEAESRDPHVLVPILYRFPWHLKTIEGVSSDTFNREFVSWVATTKERPELTLEGYTKIDPFDQWAIEVIMDDLSLGNEKKLHYQVSENLPSLTHAYQHLGEWFSRGKDAMPAEDKHGFNIVGFLLYHHKHTLDKALGIDQTPFIILTLAALCIWVLEASEVESVWFVDPIHQTK